MSKYCTRCGKQNEDQSAFCVACGAALLNVEQGPPERPPVGGASAQPPSATFTAVTERGGQGNAARDISLKDDKGDVVYVAKRKPLHQSFEICDSQGVTKGRVNHKMHVTHGSFEVCDQYENVLNVIGSGPHQKWSPPNCWLEDADGNRQGKFEFTRSGIFGLFKSDGTKVFEARLTGLAGGEGMVQRLMALASRGYTIDVFDPSFSALMLMGTIAVIETQWV
jgi:hypothetical protein